MADEKVFESYEQMSLFGGTVEEEVKNILQDRFLIPPFSVFDTKQAYWQDRKRMWLSLGIKSELGRADSLTFGKNMTNMNYDKAKKINQLLAEGKNPEDYGYKVQSGTSIFDPFLCEISYKWFNIEKGKIFDPFSGGLLEESLQIILAMNTQALIYRKVKSKPTKKTQKNYLAIVIPKNFIG